MESNWDADPPGEGRPHRKSANLPSSGGVGWGGTFPAGKIYSVSIAIG